MQTTVILSDNQPCPVRQLGLFELDGVGRDVPGPYRYSVLMATGQVLEAEYDLRTLTEIPKPPDKPANEIEPGSWEYIQLQEYETYVAALVHERDRVTAYEGWAGDIAGYILEHCLSEEDRRRVVEPADWRKVQEAALVPQLTQEVIERTLRDTFPGLVWQFRSPASVDSSSPRDGDSGSDTAVGA